MVDAYMGIESNWGKRPIVNKKCSVDNNTLDLFLNIYIGTEPLSNLKISDLCFYACYLAYIESTDDMKALFYKFALYFKLLFQI